MSEIANAEQYEAWNGESGRRWVAEADRRDEVLAPVADVLLDAARLAAGERVVDLGCGCGVTTLAAARTVGPDGAVYGVDLSEPMLDVARQRAAAAGISNITLVQADVQTHRFPHRSDVAISRFGTMFYADQVAALGQVRQGLATGGRICMATWQPLDVNEWLTVPAAALAPFGTELDRESGMFGQSDPTTVTTTLQASGFTDPQVQPVTLPLPIGADPDEAVAYIAGTGLTRTALDALPADQRPTVLDALRTALAAHAAPDGSVSLGAAIYIVTARVS